MKNIEFGYNASFFLGIIGLLIALLFSLGWFFLSDTSSAPNETAFHFFSIVIVSVTAALIGFLEFKTVPVKYVAGPLITIAAALLFVFSQLLYLFVEEIPGFILTTLLISAGLTSFTEMGRYGSRGVPRTWVAWVNTSSAFVVVAAVFASCLIGTSGHPPIPLCVLTGPFGVILLLVWIVLAWRLVRNKKNTPIY